LFCGLKMLCIAQARFQVFGLGSGGAAQRINLTAPINGDVAASTRPRA
jgi:hypothetical protein